MLIRRHCTKRHAVAYNRGRPSHGPVPEKHQTRRGSKPHLQAGFCLAQIPGIGAPALPLHGFGRDGQKGNLRRTTSSVFFTSRPPAAMKTQTGDFLDSLEGIQTMTPTRAQAAPTTQAAPATTIQLHAQAVNGLHAALHTLLHGQLDQDALARAIGKAMRGTTALKRLAALQTTVEG